jgi:peptidoglycan hydrolase-like protein with peptidoglycan-binding domain
MPNALEIQTALKKAGLFKGMIDGKIGPETKEAVRKFQQGNGITPDGVVGSKTWALLSKYLGSQQQ